MYACEQMAGVKNMAIGFLICLICLLGGCGKPPERASGEFPQDVYVWQRVWTEAVEQAVVESRALSGGRIRRVVPLVAEVNFQGVEPHVVRPAVSFEALKNGECGLALRIAPFAGPFERDDARCRFLQELAVSLVADAQKAGCRVAELQIDFDCAESKLDGYRVWVSAIRDALLDTESTEKQRTQRVKIIITALPCWLERPAFGALAREAGEFVLQVHAAEAPRAGEEPILCDIERARRWVEKAARFGVPFRVALPTYSSHVAVNEAGKIVAVSSEAPLAKCPADARVFTLRADASALARQVAAWTQDRPAAMTGVIWYRLPVSTDRMNWRWPTLNAVMDGREPRSDLRVELLECARLAAAFEIAPIDIVLVNAGERDEPLPSRIRLRWNDAKLVAVDALRGFELERADGHVTFISTFSGAVLSPGERRVVGWIRLDNPVLVYVEDN